MSATETYIARLLALQEAKCSLLRGLAGRRLDDSLAGFDLFTGLWWPLRAASPAVPRREPSWLVAKLHGAARVPHVRPERGLGPLLPAVLAVCEPSDPPEYKARDRFRKRFDALLSSPLAALEPHLRWALAEVGRAVHGRVPEARRVQGIDWARLLDELSIWDRGAQHRFDRDIRDIWAEAYLKAADARRA